MSGQVQWKTRVANATVTISGLGARGVLVPGGFILTAAHCIKWDGTGGLALGDHSIETIKTMRGDCFRVSTVAADPFSDIAVLGPADAQEFLQDYLAFEKWHEDTDAVPISKNLPRSNKKLDVHILTHDQGWIEATIGDYSAGPHRSGRLWLESDREINGGTSGSAIVNSWGQLIGVVSQSSDSNGSGPQPIAKLALPRWVWTLVLRAS